MTCFAVWAPIRPLNSSVTSTSRSFGGLPSSSRSCSHMRISPVSGSSLALAPKPSSVRLGSCWRRHDLYAEAMASSSPSRMVSKGMPFSRANSRSAVISSAFTSTSPLRGCPLGGPPLEQCPGGPDPSERDPPDPRLRRDDDGIAIRGLEDPRVGPGIIDRLRRLHLHLLTHVPLEVHRPAQGPLDAGGRHLQGVGPRGHFLDVEPPGDPLGHLRDRVEVDAALPVDGDPQDPAAGLPAEAC